MTGKKLPEYSIQVGWRSSAASIEERLLVLSTLMPSAVSLAVRAS